MSNISITRRCRRACEYCFARYERERGEVLDMPRDTYEEALAFLHRSGVPEARLLGGEPTEHPLFAEFAALALESGFSLTVFTGGLMPAASLEWLRQAAPERVTVVLNAALPGADSPDLENTQAEICRALASKIELGVNIRKGATNVHSLLGRIEQYGLRRRIRLGIAHPIWGGLNASLRQRLTLRISPLLESFISRAQDSGVEVDLDCGFTPCMFSRGFLESHAELCRSIGLRCNPIVDILPEGKAIACYALSRFRYLPLTSQSTRAGMIEQFEQELRTALPLGARRECALCGYHRSGACTGGCRARRALRLRPEPEALLDSLARNGT